MKSFETQEWGTHLMFSDGLNKALTGPIIKIRSALYTGKRFYSPKDSDHYREPVKFAPLST